MKRLPLVLRRRSTSGVAVALALLVAATAATTSGGAKRSGPDWRWDIVTVNLPAGTVVAGGPVSAKDDATGDTITLTGSGHFNTGRDKASGGGTFVHERADGSEVGSGVYHVRGLRSFRVGGGNPPNLRNAITGSRKGSPAFGRPRDGILRLDVRFVPVSGEQAQPALDGILSVYCFFEGNKLGLGPEDEGISLRIGTLRFHQTPDHHGFTVFHRLT